MADATSSRPQVNGIVETSLYVDRPAQSVEFYRRVFGFEPIDTDQNEGITEAWLSQQGITIELRKIWKYGGEGLYFRDPDGHLLEVVTPGVWSIF